MMEEKKFRFTQDFHAIKLEKSHNLDSISFCAGKYWNVVQVDLVLENTHA